MRNRRNYYRVLHVQPEAPLAVIKASYRSMMTTLNMHPDRGGEHTQAALINEAYAVLSDPDKRRAYDAAQAKRPARNGQASATRAASPAHAASRAERCAFCTAPAPSATAPRCARCDSPLQAVKRQLERAPGELFGRRTAPRIARTAGLIVYPAWPHAGDPATLRDFSPTGLRMVLHTAYRAGQVIKIDSSLFKCTARVVWTRARSGIHTTHVEFLTVEFLHKAGVMVSARV